MRTGLQNTGKSKTKLRECSRKCAGQDEFNVDVAIEDDEARKLMAETALKSCHEKLSRLEEKHERSILQARQEHNNIESAQEHLKSLGHQCLLEHIDDDDKSECVSDKSRSSIKEAVKQIQEIKGAELSMEKVKDGLDVGSMVSLTVTELVEMIDKLVNKVITLETEVLSQTVLINTLRTNADYLHVQIQVLDVEKETLIDRTHILTNKLKEMEEIFRKLQELNKNVENQNSNLQTNFTEAHNSLDQLSDKLSSMRPDEKSEEINSSQDQENNNPSPGDGENFTSASKTEDAEDVKGIGTTVECKGLTGKTVTFPDPMPKEPVLVDNSDDLINAQGKGSIEKEELNWQQMLLSGMEDKEKILLKEYAAILRNYKDTKKKLGDVEKREREYQFDISLQIRELENGKTKRDGEIRCLRQKLNLTQENEINNDSTRLSEPESRTMNSEVEESTSTIKEEVNLAFIDRPPSICSVEKSEEINSSQDQENNNPSPGDGENFTSASKTEDAEDVKGIGTTVECKGLTGKTVTFPDPMPKEPVLVDNSDDLINAQGKGSIEKEELNWQQMLLSGMEDKEKILLKEYAAILRNYKDTKKKLGDVEKREREYQFDISLQIRELENGKTKRDGEIRCLRQKLNLTQENEINNDSTRLSEPESRTMNSEVEESTSTIKEEVNLAFIDRPPSICSVEEKLRTNIDAVLDDNLDFWLRFSTAFHQIQKFKTEIQDLQDELSKLLGKKVQVGSVTSEQKSEVRPIYKHLREIQIELTAWLEQSVPLKDELKRRFSPLCNIQDEITKALKGGVGEGETRFSSHQAAKFQGEISNMKQKNNKVKEELQTGLDHLSTLQLQIEKSLRKLNEEIGISSDQPQLKQAKSKAKIPLRAFIFGTRQKKRKNSIF